MLLASMLHPSQRWSPAMPATTWTPTSCKVCCMLGERNPRSLWCAMTRVCGSKRLRTCSSVAFEHPTTCLGDHASDEREDLLRLLVSAGEPGSPLAGAVPPQPARSAVPSLQRSESIAGTAHAATRPAPPSCAGAISEQPETARMR